MDCVQVSHTSRLGRRATLIIGIPTAVIPSPWFSRTIPTRWWDYLVLGLTALLAGAIGGTYALPTACPINSRRLTLGGTLSYFAVSCPLCNRLVLLVLGAGGAVTYFQPMQPVLAVGSLGLLAVTLWKRVINGHDAPLPKYRGRNATGWILRNGEREGALTVHYMASDLDSGPILAQRRYPITDDDLDIEPIVRRFFAAHVPVFSETFDLIAAGDPGMPQYESQVTYARSAFEPEWRVIDWSRRRRAHGDQHNEDHRPLCRQ